MKLDDIGLVTTRSTGNPLTVGQLRKAVTEADDAIAPDAATGLEGGSVQEVIEALSARVKTLEDAA